MHVCQCIHTNWPAPGFKAAGFGVFEMECMYANVFIPIGQRLVLRLQALVFSRWSACVPVYP